jgi:GTPase SAR1 family protein
LADGVFTENPTNTIGNDLIELGIDFKIMLVKVNGMTHKLQLWEAGDNEQFRALTTNYYRGASTVILVYAIDDIESFESIKGYHQ